ncbi:MAG: Glucose-repressible alcohol dehydrogenase transcriptional effector [Vezdaea aestivalis]|nr:MAG: Glucose-repressible alcohol dehydrogenase transcriptional effector [Vezdaea aestivalis]
MADGTYQYQQRAGQSFYHPQASLSNQHNRQLTRAPSPTSNSVVPFSVDTPSPSRSPTLQSPAHLYGIYNNQIHQQQQQSHNSMLNGNQTAQRFTAQLNMGQKFQQQQQHHAHNQHNAHTHQPNQHQDHNAHNANHQHTYSSGGLSNATPQFTPGHMPNGSSNGQGGTGKFNTEYFQHQMSLQAESRNSNSPNYYARQSAAQNKLLLPVVQMRNEKENEPERQRPIQVIQKKSQWGTLDISGHGLRSLSPAIFNYDFLTVLYLSYNRLTSVPSGIGRMRSLTYLDLSGNQIRELPAEMGMLVKLKNLMLFDNQIQSLPFELGSLYRLEILGVEGNPLRDDMRTELMQNGTTALITYLREQAPVTLPPSQRDWVVLSSSLESEEDKLSVLNYNILCDKYATKSQYGYTPSQALSWDYRKELILNEIQEQNADVVCLQEIDNQSFNDYFRPKLAYADYKGVFHPKSRARTMGDNEAKLVDGCATFYKNAKYILLDKQIIDFANSAINRPDMKGEHDMFNRVMPKDNIALITFFENRMTGSRLIVGNAHIHWDPVFKDVKVVQVAILVEQINKFAEKYSKWPAVTDKAAFRHSEASNDDDTETEPEPRPEPKPSLQYGSGPDIPLLLCGDFNSMSDSGVYELLAKGAIPGNHPDLEKRSYGTFTRDGMSHPFSLKSAYSNMGELTFTNYTPDFTEVVDYVWYSTNALEATGLLGEVDQEHLTRVPGFPNYHFPSDHLPLLAQFSVKPQITHNPTSKPDFGPQGNRR